MMRVFIVKLLARKDASNIYSDTSWGAQLGRLRGKKRVLSRSNGKLCRFLSNKTPFRRSKQSLRQTAPLESSGDWRMMLGNSTQGTRMQKIQFVGLLVLFCCATARAQTLAERVPRDAIAYLGWKGADSPETVAHHGCRTWRCR
jgi:hypothetical protein